ncbi:aldehyde dehydrogenase family protein [Rubrobacter marinus]|uniref:Aldehyde dehydrogenase family protein n=1 Tax=Rubrobacter marinus TaxID=2653852 RepID=A0A6G8PVJ0_9ACTN|nr:succinic semialdehyde dehydrogenase [Rubrobacter marinus]QIN78187.1 aldehyde dehydrogenase family protein [Rubrobacter marinus]
MQVGRAAYGTRGRIDAALLERLGERVTLAGGDREEIEVEAPFTGEVLGSVPRGTGDDVREAARRARAAQKSWARTSFEERARIFMRFHDLVLKRQDEVLDLVQLESGKARGHAFEEVLDVAIVARYYARTAKGHLRPRRRQGAYPLLTSTREYHHPKGVAGFIVPWNYPLTLAVTDAIPALMAGNGAVVKPDAQTPFAALWAAELLLEAGLPRDLFGVVTGRGAELGAPLIESVDFLMFTGSTRTGRTVAAQAAERLIDYSMELGGKNAMIVLGDADLEKATEGAVRACFSNAGQLCISIERLFVHDGVYERFAEAFARKTRALKLGGALNYSAEMGSLVSGKQLETVEGHVRDAVEKGAAVLAGGRPRPDLGPYFYEPTVLAQTTAGMTLFAEETFGPVVSLQRFSSVDEAVERANDSPYGLNASVWTGDEARGRSLATRLRSGTVNVNEAYAAAWGSTDAPMGGFGDSGVGRRHGAHGIQKYTEAQTVAAQRVLPVAPPPGLGAERYARVATAALRVLSRLPGLK